MRVKFCPNCGSSEIELFVGGRFGLWECKKCGFRSAIFPEKDFDEKKETKKKRSLKK